MCVCVCVCVRARVCVRVCVRACVRACGLYAEGQVMCHPSPESIGRAFMNKVLKLH